MTPLEELIKKIRKIKRASHPIENSKLKLACLDGGWVSYFKLEDLIKTFLQDYALVKKGDLLTEKELADLNYYRRTELSLPEIWKKLKSLGGGE